MTIMRSYVPMLAVAGILGCDSGYVYAPETANVVNRSGVPGQKTDIPQERPQGSVQVLSQGIHHVALAEGKVPALHVRMSVSNDGDATPWRVDASKQLADIPGKGLTAPLFVSQEAAAITEIPQHARRTIDLYYALPPNVTDTSQMKHFELVWTVDTAERTVSSRISFDRTYPYYNDYYAYGYGYGYGYGPWWGWGPYWGYSAYNPGYVYPRVRGVAVVTGPAARMPGHP
jgi:hypothetical protein